MKKIISIIIILLALTSFNYSQYQVNAGTTSNNFIREGMFDESEVGIGDWKSKGNISVVNGELFFNDKSTSDNILVNRTSVISSPTIKDTFYINFNLNLKTFSENKRFGLAYGLETFIKTIGSPKSSFIYFKKTGSNYYVGISSFNSIGVEQIVLNDLQLKSSVDVNNIFVEVAIKNDNSIKLMIDKEIVFVSSLTDSVGRVDGYVGFGQVGEGVANFKNEIYLKFNQLTNLYYETPTTPRETISTFDNDEFNTNEWYIENRRVNESRGIVVEDGALFFDGAGGTDKAARAMFSTKYVYSNFECIFDVFDAKNTVGVNDPLGVSNGLLIALGDGYDSADANTSVLHKGTIIAFDAGRDTETGERTRDTYAYVSYDGGQAEVIRDIPAKYGFFNEGFNPSTKVRINISLIDGVLEIKLKLATEIEYTTIYKHVYTDYNTPRGCIRLMGNHYVPASGNSKFSFPTNLKIDDIRIYNYDVNPSIVSVDFNSNKTKEIPDYQYVDTWSKSDLLDFTFGK